VGTAHRRDVGLSGIAEAVDFASRPLMEARKPGATSVPQGDVHFNVAFNVTKLDDGFLGVAATFQQPAQGGGKYYSHHMVKLDVVASEWPFQDRSPTEPSRR
jgi:hypothetical protein